MSHLARADVHLKPTVDTTPSRVCEAVHTYGGNFSHCSSSGRPFFRLSAFALVAHVVALNGFLSGQLVSNATLHLCKGRWYKR